MNWDSELNKGRRYNEYLRLLEKDSELYEYMVSFSFNSNIRSMEVGWMKMGKFRELLEKYDCYCKGYIVGERNKSNMVHFHSLLYNCGEGFEELVLKKWSKYNGYVHFVKFEKGKNGEKYILKDYLSDGFVMLNWEVI